MFVKEQGMRPFSTIHNGITANSNGLDLPLEFLIGRERIVSFHHLEQQAIRPMDGGASRSSVQDEVKTFREYPEPGNRDTTGDARPPVAPPAAHHPHRYSSQPLLSVRMKCRTTPSMDPASRLSTRTTSSALPATAWTWPCRMPTH